MAKKDYNIITFAYNKNTLMLVQNFRVSFLSIIPLAQQRNYEILDDSQIKHFEKKVSDIVNNLQAFDGGGLNDEGTLGPAYKLISLYTKLSPLQRYQLKKGFDELSFINTKETSDDEEEYFLKEKSKYTTNECLSYNEYTKEDFIIVRTFIPQSQYSKIIPKKVLPVDYFMNLDEEEYLKIKNKIDQMYLMHKQNVNENIANDYYDEISPYTVMDIIAKLNLNVATDYFNNFNAFEKNVWGDFEEKEKNWQITIFENEADTIPYVLIIEPTNLTIYDPKKVGTEMLKIFSGQKVEMGWNASNTVFSIELVDGDNRVLIKKVNNPFKVEESYEKRYKYDYTLSQIPLVFDNNISEMVSNVLKNSGFQEFNIITEVVKKPVQNLERQIEWSKRTYSLLSQLPSLGGKLFNPDLVVKKLHAFESTLYHLEDGREFSTVRFSFAVTLPYYKEPEDLTLELNQKLATFSLDVELLAASSKKITDPMAYEPFLSIPEKAMELENSEIKNLINLKYSNEYFNMLEDNNDENLAKIDNAHIYIKVAEKVQSLNIFEGPDMFNGLIIAPSGSGKSFITVNLIDGFMGSNPENLCWILDRGGSYVNFTATFGGNNINLKKTDELNCINPFVFDNYFAKLMYVENLLYLNKNYQRKIDLGKHKEEEADFQSKINKNIEEIEQILSLTKFRGRDTVLRDKTTNAPELTDFEDLMPQDRLEIFVLLLETMLRTRDLSDNNQRILNLSIYDAIKELILEQIDYSENNDLIKYLLISDIKEKVLYKVIEAGINKKEAVSILSILDEYIDPIRSGKLFNGKPALDLSSLLINIDFGEIQNETLADLVLSALLLNYFNVMTSDKYKFSKKLLIIDEAHAVLNGTEISGLKSVSYLYRTARKHGGAVWLLSQGINDFVKVTGEVEPVRVALFGGIIGNAGWIWLLGKHPKKGLMERLDLNESIADRIVNKGASREFYIISKVSGFANLIVSDLNYAIATTNKEEKNILAAITLLTQNTKNSLLVFAALFGQKFLKVYKDITNLKNEFGANVDMDEFKIKIENLFSSYSPKTKEKVVEKILNTTKINIEIINVLMLKAEIDSKLPQFKAIIDACESFHEDED